MVWWFFGHSWFCPLIDPVKYAQDKPDDRSRRTRSNGPESTPERPRRSPVRSDRSGVGAGGAGEGMSSGRRVRVRSASASASCRMIRC